MSSKIIALSAALGMLGATAVSAQTSPPAAQPQTTPPSTTSPMAPTTPPSKMAPAPGSSASMTDSKGDRFLAQQQPGQRLATDYMKKSILGANNERIGDVTNLLLSEDGQVVAVVVGVGGFLGIGEKSVALPLSA